MLDDLRPLLASGSGPGRQRVTVLCGLGGIGKISFAAVPASTASS
jgi:hypothetical protein